MKVSVQTDSPRLLREALKSGCSGVRFGSEFCEQLLPSLRMLETAYELACEQGKAFTYVTPRLSNAGIEKLKEQLPRLSDMGELTGSPHPTVVANDFGTLHILQRYPHLEPHLGRNLFLVPARSAWAEGHLMSEEASSERGKWVRDLYSSISLSYRPTIERYRHDGCRKVDVDWIPHILSSLRLLVKQGLRLSVLLHLVPVTFTRKCHTARFLGEKSPETCSKPCLTRVFVLKNEAIREYEAEFGLKLFLSGNTVFRLVRPSPGDIADLEEAGVAEVVLTLNRITGIDTTEGIDEFIVTQCEGRFDSFGAGRYNGD